MKLIIEIDENLYEKYKDNYYADNYISSSNIERTFNAIANGTPLTDCTDCISRSAVLDKWYSTSVRGRTEFDQIIMMLPSVNPTTDLSKIRAEIIDKYMTADGRMGSVSADILKIIDKYSKGGE